MLNINWLKVAPGIWRAVVGQPESGTPLELLGRSPALEALAVLGDRAFPFPDDALVAESVDSRTIAVFPLAPDEKLFGSGLQFMKLDQRGRTRYLRVNSDLRQDTGETHAPVPICISSRGYGVLANTARIITMHCGSCGRRARVRRDGRRHLGGRGGERAGRVTSLLCTSLPAIDCTT